MHRPLCAAIVSLCVWLCISDVTFALNTTCHIIQHAVDKTNHNVLAPVLHWDLLRNAVAETAIADSVYGTLWRLTRKHTLVRSNVLQFLGAPLNSPLSKDKLGLLTVNVHLTAATTPTDYNNISVWFYLNCQYADTTKCEAYLESLGYWRRSLLNPLYANGMQIVHNPAIANALDLSPSSAAWQQTTAWTLRGYRIEQSRFLLAECNHPTTTTITTAVNHAFTKVQLYGSNDRERFLQYVRVTQQVNICPDCWCVASFNTTLDDRLCTVCFSAANTKQVQLISDLAHLRSLPKHAILQLAPQRYLGLTGPLHVVPISNAVQTCAVVINKEISNKLIEQFTFDGSHYTIQMRGLVLRAADAFDVGISSFPELDGVRAMWILVLALILMRRLLIPDDSLMILYILSRTRPNATKGLERIIPTHRSLLVTDVLLLIIFIVVTAWYIAASIEFLPPAPTYPLFYLTAVLAGISLLVVIIAHLITAQHTFANGRQYVAAFFHTAFLWMAEPKHVSVPTHAHPRTWFIATTLQRSFGTIVILISIMYSMWWDTDDVYHWAVNTLVAYGIFVALLDYAITMSAAMRYCRSFTYGMIASVGLAASVVYGVFAVLDLIIPFAIYVNASTYSDTAVTFIVWMLIAISAMCVIRSPYVHQERVRTNLIARLNNPTNTDKTM